MSTSKSAESTVDAPPNPVPRRIRILLFHGTGGSPTAGSHETLLDALTDLLPESPFIEITHIPGVGTHSGRIGNLTASSLGSHAVKDKIIASIKHLADNYHPNDELVIIGYSRGSYTARSFVGFLDRVGLPSEKNRHVLRDLYDKYTKGKFLKRGTTLHLKRKYKCRDVRIKALICIDTVGSLGLPHTGIFRVLEFFRSHRKKNAFMEINSSSNVDTLLHALALHETRGPFEPTLMHISNNTHQVLKQVWFPGGHGDIAREEETGCIADSVFAWLIANIEEATHIVFSEARLAVRFPRMNTATFVQGPDLEDWVNDPMQRANRGLWRLMGRARRVPGSWHRDGMQTHETIHITARLRGYGRLPGSQAVAGYTCREREGMFYWERNGGDGNRTRPFDFEAPAIINEAAFSAREAQLLGVVP